MRWPTPIRSGAIGRALRTRKGLLALLAALGLTGSACGGSGPDVDGAEISANRRAAETQIQAVLGPVAAGGPVYGRGRADGCNGGQDNWVIRDDFKYMCSKGEALVVGLGTTPGVKAAAVRADGLLAAACAPGAAEFKLADDHDGLAAFRQRREAASVASFRCNGVTLDAWLLRPEGAAAAQSSLSGWPYAGLGTVVEKNKLDASGAARAAAAQGEQFLLALQARVTYHRVER